jgi:hypothetical protein
MKGAYRLYCISGPGGSEWKKRGVERTTRVKSIHACTSSKKTIDLLKVKVLHYRN